MAQPCGHRTHGRSEGLVVAGRAATVRASRRQIVRTVAWLNQAVCATPQRRSEPAPNRAGQVPPYRAAATAIGPNSAARPPAEVKVRRADGLRIRSVG